MNRRLMDAGCSGWYFNEVLPCFHAGAEFPMRRCPEKICCRGRTYPVQETVRLRGRRYWVVGRLGNRGRRKLQVFDPAARDLRVIHLLPRTHHAEQQLRVLRRTGRLDGWPKILDTERRVDETWVLTDWIWGDSLSSYLQQAKRGRKRWPSAHTAWTLFARLVHGVSQFHDFTMCVHGDIKPPNLIVQAEPQRLRLIDFGSAWNEEVARLRETGDGHSIGYGAPELRNEGRATMLVDQFSATVVLHEMLTGELPYEGMGGRAGWPEYIGDFGDKLQPPSDRCRGEGALPNPAWRLINRIVCRSLALSPDERFPTSNAWRDAVDEVSRVLSHALVRPPWQQKLVQTVERITSYWARNDRAS